MQMCIYICEPIFSEEEPLKKKKKSEGESLGTIQAKLVPLAFMDWYYILACGNSATWLVLNDQTHCLAKLAYIFSL